MPPVGPVVTMCGHLYCWRCVCREEECPHCLEPVDTQQQIVAIRGGDDDDDVSDLPPLPRAKIWGRTGFLAVSTILTHVICRLVPYATLGSCFY